MRSRLSLAILGLGVAGLLSVPGVSAAATVVNGGFETGDFSGWTVVNQSGGSGNWFVYSGTSTPHNGFAIAAPPEGTYAATTDSGGPGSHVLYQDVALEPGFNHILSLQVYYENQTGLFAPASLDYRVTPNQQYRVDILRPSAPVDSVAPGDVLANVFRTSEGDPNSLGPTPVSFDLSGFAGATVRIRLAEVDNQFYLNASADAVAVTSSPALPSTRMVGKGSVSDHGLKAAYAYILPCDAAHDADASFESRTGGNILRLTSVESVVCRDDPAVPTSAAGFDTQRGSGTATLNGRPGYELKWKLVDGGPGGTSDFVRARVTGPGGSVVFRGSAAPPGKFPGSDQPTGNNTAQFAP